MFERGSTRVCQAFPASPPAEPEAEIAEDTEPARAGRFVQARQTQAAVDCVNRTGVLEKTFVAQPISKEEIVGQEIDHVLAILLWIFFRSWQCPAPSPIQIDFGSRA